MSAMQSAFENARRLTRKEKRKIVRPVKGGLQEIQSVVLPENWHQELLAKAVLLDAANAKPIDKNYRWMTPVLPPAPKPGPRPEFTANRPAYPRVVQQRYAKTEPEYIDPDEMSMALIPTDRPCRHFAYPDVKPQPRPEAPNPRKEMERFQNQLAAISAAAAADRPARRAQEAADRNENSTINLLKRILCSID